MVAIRLGEAILALHLLIITFNIAGLIIIPFGAWRGWHLVRVAWLRLLHLGLMGIVAAQALAGRACILTLWQNDLAAGATTPPPLMMNFINSLIYWKLQFWCFTVLYCAVFLYILALCVFIPFGGGALTPQPSTRKTRP